MPKYVITDLGLDSSLPYQHELKLLINIGVIPLKKLDHGRTYTCFLLAISEAFCNYTGFICQTPL